MTTRITRSRSRQPPQIDGIPVVKAKDPPSPSTQKDVPDVTPISGQLSHVIVGMDQEDFDIMLLKQRKLKDTQAQGVLGGSDLTLSKAVAATLVFAQQEAGTAVCVSPAGLLLTCAHCIVEAGETDTGIGEERWLLFASGRAVRARCTAWDPVRDLALLHIIAAQTPASQTATTFTFPSIPVSRTMPKYNAALLCIGHPGSEDLEASTAGIATDYDVLHVSTGRCKGMAKGQDLQDNSDIGALKHNCWTYWGHSGAPLVRREDGGGLVGLHSSWDSETAMRRGVPLQAIRAFLGEHATGVMGT